MAELERYFELLASKKVSDRQKACMYLNEVINSQSVIDSINERGSQIWLKLVWSLQQCMIKDGDKAVEDYKKKGNFVNKACISADIYSNYIRVALRQTPEVKLKFSKIIDFILNILQDKLRRVIFESALLKVLSDCILSNSSVRSSLVQRDWEVLYEFSKTSCGSKTSCTSLNSEFMELKCLALLIKWGPLHTLPIGTLRDDFQFITKLCKMTCSTRPQKEAVLEIVYEFCLHTAKDSRMSCCKLGEEVFHNLRDFYELNAKEDVLKVQLINFFLLQIALHNPRGATQDQPLAYAVSWTIWQRCLQSVQYIVVREVEINTGSFKNVSLFVTKNGVSKMTKPFVLLFVEVHRQIIHFNVNNQSASTSSNVEGPPPKKRARSGTVLEELIDRVHETRFWPWINFIYALVETYPEVLTPDDYLLLLQTFSTLLVDCKNPDLNYHLYKALVVLEKIHDSVVGQSSNATVKNLWISVGKNILRSAGSSDKHKQKLLANLISRGYVDPEDLFPNFRSKIVHVTPHSLSTLKQAMAYFKYAQSDCDLKKDLIAWLLNVKSVKCPKYLTGNYVAEFLVRLTLKQWPELGFSGETPSLNDDKLRPFADIEESYSKTYFENLILGRQESPVINSAENLTTYCLDSDMFGFLLDTLKKFRSDLGEDCQNNPRTALSLFILIFNVAGIFLKHNLAKDAKKQSLLNVFDSCKTYLENVVLTSILDLTGKPDDRHYGELTSIIEVLNELFLLNTETSLTDRLRSFVSQELMRSLFEVLNIKDNENEQLSDVSNNAILNLQKSAIETISSFMWIHDRNGAMSNMQKRSLSLLITDDYDVTSQKDYELVMTLLYSIKKCSPDSVDEETLVSICNLIQQLCEARHSCYLSAVQILRLYYEIYPVLVSYNSEMCTNQLISLLKPFYTERQKYGPEVSVLLLKCMTLIHEHDPSGRLSKWSNEPIVGKIPEFLKSDHQSVRLAAVENLTKFFAISGKSKQLSDFHLQEIIFSKLCGLSLNVFEIEGDQLKPERVIDETVCRTSSVLHTYVSIIATSYLWQNDALYTLLKIVSEKKIHIEEVKKALDLLTNHLKFTDTTSFFEKHLPSVFAKWRSNDVDSFPFPVTGEHQTKIAFYMKFWNLLSPLIIESDVESVEEIALNSQKSVSEMIEETSPKLLSYCLAKLGSQKLLHSMEYDKVYKYLIAKIGFPKLYSVCESRIDEILLSLMNYVYDENDFRQKFGLDILFQQNEQIKLNVQQFLECIKFIEVQFRDRTNIWEHLLQKQPEKVHSIFLHLKFALHTSLQTEDKLRSFHLYSVITESILKNFANSGENIQLYCTRDLIYTLLHFIKSHNSKTTSELSLLSCRFFKTVLEIILPNHAQILQNFFLVIVSALKNTALKVEKISQNCIDLLQILVVDHARLFLVEISKLDAFPGTEKFQRIRQSHKSIKYSQKVCLDVEIRQFLDFGKSIESLDEYEDGLKHLRILLSNKNNKMELKTLYENLKSTRGFSEDCHKSVLHQLICILIKLSCSENRNVSSEAVRCLGEIGPGDLSTLVLEPEQPISDTKWSPWELVNGHVIFLLGKYLIDDDVHVIKEASRALFKVLDTREGRKVAESNFDVGNIAIYPSYLTPFFPAVPRRTSFNLSTNTDSFYARIPQDELWTPQDPNCSHKMWITNLVCTLLQTFVEEDYFNTLIAVCKLKVEFCETLLPLIIFVILDTTKDQRVFNIIETKIKQFFNEHWTNTILNKEDSKKIITVNKSSVQCMLNVVNFIRLQKHAKNSKRPQEDLKLNYLKIAKAAQFCTAQFTALMYAELWCQEQIETSREDYEDSSYGMTQLDMIYENVNEVNGTALQDILRKAYKAIGEVDALLGCGTSCLLKPEFRIEYYKELGKWEQVVHHYEMKVSHGSTSSLNPLMEGLKNCNLYQLSAFCSNFNQEPDFESLWRLSQWNFDSSKNKLSNFDSFSSVAKTSSSKNLASGNGYEKFKFLAFKQLHNHDDFNFRKSIENIRNSIVKNLHDVSLESSKNFYSILTNLQSLKELEDFSEALLENKIEELLDKWKLQDDVIQNDFVYLEPIKSQRIVLLTEFLKYSHRDGLWIVLVDMILKFAEYCRVEGHCSVAQRILTELRHNYPDLAHDVKARLQIEEAQLCWMTQDAISARCILRHLCAEQEVSPKIHAMALKMTGKWLVESSSENRQSIIDNYFLKSLSLLDSADELTPEDRLSEMDTYIQLAKFADHEYQQVMEHVKSDVYQRKVETMKKVKQEICSVGKDVARLPRDMQKSLRLKQHQSNVDECEIDNILEEKIGLLKHALNYYIENLKYSDAHNVAMFRLISLFLENRNNDVAKKIMQSDLLKLPAYKFIDVLPQLVPHLAGNDVLSETVNKILYRCSVEHPHHTLPLILSLAHATKDQDYNAEATSKIEKRGDGRTQSAKMLLEKLKKESSLQDLIKKMEQMSDALIELAYVKQATGSSADEKTEIRIQQNRKIRKLKDMENVAVPTVYVQVKKNRDYADIVGISSFGQGYHNVGGINAPKRISCMGTDGLNRSQLVKGKDDLRQDAVMQQVFTIMNSLLAGNKETKNLLIRTYKVVPLSMRSGILEWVENSMPIAEYLTGAKGTTGAHVLYRPTDVPPGKCRAEFKQIANKNRNEDKLKIYKKICQNIKPVLHKFFETNFPHPTVWYERRRAYIRSVATSSMCGYILGIGDRHVNNILIDKSTAEVIHIDFGIAFEQGRALPTPETVPFRLTRDIVDGMGASGIEGVFRRSCEKTVEVLRHHYQTIVTILEVLLYDPLYDWILTTGEANKRQFEDDDDVLSLNTSTLGAGTTQSGSDENFSKVVNVTAERALLRLKAKLRGTENGNPTSVEHQVGTLIQQAMDPTNLCRLYQGWQPYL